MEHQTHNIDPRLNIVLFVLGSFMTWAMDIFTVNYDALKAIDLIFSIGTKMLSFGSFLVLIILNYEKIILNFNKIFRRR